MCFLKALEALLPPRPRTEIPTGEHVEEVNLMDFDTTRGFGGGQGGRSEAYNGDDDDDDEGHGGHPRMQCQHQ